MSRDGFVIAGGGLAAQRACEALRRRGHEETIRLVCAEPALPYDRPPLSKELLAGAAEPEQIVFRPRPWYRDNHVDVLLETRAVRLDTTARRVELSTGRALRYEQLLIATGALPRRLPSLERFANATTLRSAADAVALRTAIRRGGRLVVIGAGLIGQEVAATARAAGVAVTIVEAAAAPLAGELGPRLGAWFAELHRSEGVELITGARVAAARGAERVEELMLEDGRRLGCDHVLVCIGVAPELSWLAGSGLDTTRLRVDASGFTGAAGVFAAGDAAAWFDPRRGEHVPGSHWEAAARQGAAAAAAMLGLASRPQPVPMFWSDQYGLRINCVGHARDADSLAIDGDPRSRRFSALFRRGAELVGALLVGVPERLPALRRDIEASFTPT